MPELKNANLLIVDDSLVARMAVKRMLEAEVGTIAEASSGTVAIELLKKKAFDCILMDYLMPGLNGMTTLKIIREMQIKTPVVIISANQQEAVIAKFNEMKVSAILKKHVNKQELLDALENALKNAGEN